jgi:hypothetical protein
MASPAVDASQAASYLVSYITEYRREFERFTAAPPLGAGVPARATSPYLTPGAFTCLLARDGSAIIKFGQEPQHAWHIAGGPALMPDFEPTRTPDEVTQLLRRKGILGKPIGIHRIVAPSNDIPAEAWRGELPAPTSTASRQVADGTTVEACELDLDWSDLVARLTFGAFGPVLDVRLDPPTSPYWKPIIVTDLGFFPADRSARRFFRYLELAPHRAPGAWDEQSIWARVYADVRRDFAQAPTEEGGGIRWSGEPPVGAPESLEDVAVEDVTARLPLLEEAIAELRSALALDPSPKEESLQRLFEKHPLLLNVYGRVQPKPRFEYPAHGGPTGKTFVEPDFLVIEDLVSGPRYELIEIERPGKQLATQAGHARVDLTQAAWQIGEWKSYIDNHYDLIRDKFPGVPNHRTTIIISRATESSFAGSNFREYLDVARSQLRVDDILLYDDVLRRAQTAYDRLVAAVAA